MKSSFTSPVAHMGELFAARQLEKQEDGSHAAKPSMCSTWTMQPCQGNTDKVLVGYVSQARTVLSWQAPGYGDSLRTGILISLEPV